MAYLFFAAIKNHRLKAFELVFIVLKASSQAIASKAATKYKPIFSYS